MRPISQARASLSRRQLLAAAAALRIGAQQKYPLSYPPQLPGGREWVSDQSLEFLKPPPRLRPGVAIARKPPLVDFMFYPGQDHPGGPWSVWGDGSVSGDKYYSAIGDHLSPRGTALVCEYTTSTRKLRLLVNLREFLESSGAIEPGMNYVPSKVHSRIEAGRDGWVYFSTHRGSPKTTTDAYGYKGDWILRVHPADGRTEIVATHPVPKHSIPAGLLDPERMIFYGGTASGQDAPAQGAQFFAYDLTKHKLLKSAGGGFERCAILARSTGRLYWDGKVYDPQSNQISPSQAPSVRSATQETPQGLVYGTSARSADLWAFDVRREQLGRLGPGAVAKQEYTTSIDADLTGRYLYYVPGAHGGTAEDGAAVVQYDVQTRKAKVIAFLHDFYYRRYGYQLDGTFSSALDARGATLYVTWNGMRKGQPKGWESCALTVIHIPASERPVG